MAPVVPLAQRDPGRWMVLLTCIIAVLMVAIDSGLLTLIVPSIQQDLNVSQSTTGLLFSISTLMLASSAGALTGIRGLDDICQALVNPLALAILTITFDDEERPKALGIYGATLGISGGFSVDSHALIRSR